MIRKGYTDGPFGQIHWRMKEPAQTPSQPDLYCLHPAPFSGLAFTTIMPFLAQDRRVIAPDFPGHGGSDIFTAKPSVAEYAEAMRAVVADQSHTAPIDIIGFHTGNLVAVEMACETASSIRKLALVDIPAFDPEDRAKFLSSAAQPFAITPELHCLEAPWDRGMTKRLASQGPDRSFEIFVEQLRHGQHMNAAFHAAFSYDVEIRLPLVLCPTLILATQSMLLDATRRGAGLMPTARLVERLDIKRAVLDEAAGATAAEIMCFLDGKDTE
ncbi:MAG: alpha/beta hydrolase [Parasphingorhabdus sp.]|uniref:alpha/beta fold hydrolase n=1 Tax=Parasphingorhabdus sp. TaxID=2709688 RepID=UPI00326483B0